MNWKQKLEKEKESIEDKFQARNICLPVCLSGYCLMSYFSLFQKKHWWVRWTINGGGSLGRKLIQLYREIQCVLLLERESGKLNVGFCKGRHTVSRLAKLAAILVKLKQKLRWKKWKYRRWPTRQTQWRLACYKVHLPCSVEMVDEYLSLLRSLSINRNSQISRTKEFSQNENTSRLIWLLQNQLSPIGIWPFSRTLTRNLS